MPWQFRNIDFKRLRLSISEQKGECGLACLEMIANYHGRRIDKHAARASTDWKTPLSSFLVLEKWARKAGLEPTALRFSAGGLRFLRTPCILHWSGDHFVVLKKAGRFQSTIYNPSGNIQRVTSSRLERICSGFAMEFSCCIESTIPDVVRPAKVRLLDLLRQTDGIGSAMWQTTALALPVQVCALLAPLYLKIVIDRVLPNKDTDLLFVAAIGFATIAAFQVITSVFRTLLMHGLSTQLSYRLNAALFGHALKLPLEFFQKRHLGDILNRFGSLEHVKAFLTGNFIVLVIDTVMSIILIWFLFYYSAQLAFIVVAFMIADAGVRMMVFRPIRRSTEESLDAAAVARTNMMESIRAISCIKVFGRETDRHNRWKELSHKQYSCDLRVTQLQTITNGARHLLSSVETIILVFVGATLTIDSTFSAGMLLAFIAYKSQLTSSVTSVVGKIGQFAFLQVHLARLSDIYCALPDRAVNHSHPIQETNKQSQLDLSQVSYRYINGGNWVIRDFSMSVRKGETIALVGPSGAGKSTIIAIALGLIHPQEGQVLLDGTSLSDIPQSTFRKTVSAVSQGDPLLVGTIAENISFFDNLVDPEIVRTCASAAAVHDEIMALPDQYDTPISDLGDGLSGGQKQRILIARALYAKPKILVFDEATNSVDAENEIRIFSEISNLGISVLFTTHSERLLAFADRTIVIPSVAA